MELTKLEIQQMLREMHIKFPADESYESLRIRLQKENNQRWLRSISRNGNNAATTTRRIIRKRKPVLPQPQDADDDGTGAEASKAVFDHPHERKYAESRSEQEFGQDLNPDDRPAVFVKDKKTGHDPEKVFSRTKNVLESIMRRADNRCELCDIKRDSAMENGETANLELHYIIPLSEGGEHSIKNAVVLCPDCRETVNARKNPSDIKKLKRKAREKIYSSVEVIRKVKLKRLRGARHTHNR